MRELGHRRPGDRLLRRRIWRRRLRRVLGVPALYSAGYGNVGSSIYYALGIVALFALGATPIALFVAGLFFICTALTYAEGTAMFPEAGGSASFARHGFNELVGFISGWALLLSYIVTISISAFTIPPYLGLFWEPLKESAVVGTIASMGIVSFLMVLNVLGVRETSLLNISAAVLDLTTQGLLVVLGFALLFSPGVLQQHMFGLGNFPTASNLIFGIALAALAYTGVETMSQMAEETRRPAVRVPKALMLMMVTVLIMFAGISLVALSAMPPETLATEWARDPVAGIAASLPSPWLQAVLKPLVAILAATILFIATNAGLMGISRLAFSLGSNRQLPTAFSRVHRRFGTPYISIICFSLVAVAILLPGLFVRGVFADLGALYTFGSLLSFALAHAAILSLRLRRPKLPRPFKPPGNIRIGGREFPLTALIGLLATGTIWLVVIVIQPYSRWVGLSWMALGLAAYFLYRRHQRLPLSRPPDHSCQD